MPASFFRRRSPTAQPTLPESGLPDFIAIEHALDAGALDVAAAGVAALPVKAYEIASAHTLTGRLHLACGRKQAAIECFETALALDPGDLWSLCTLASCRMDDGDPASAAELFERAMGAAPATPGLLYNCARALLEAGRFDAARGHIDRLCAQEIGSDAANLLQARIACTDNDRPAS